MTGKLSMTLKEMWISIPWPIGTSSFRVTSPRSSTPQ
jgi:hypothetical protein